KRLANGLPPAGLGELLQLFLAGALENQLDGFLDDLPGHFRLGECGDRKARAEQQRHRRADDVATLNHNSRHLVTSSIALVSAVRWASPPCFTASLSAFSSPGALSDPWTRCVSTLSKNALSWSVILASN